MNSHEENIAEFLSLGGSEKSIRLYRSPSLPNRSKVLHLLKTLRSKVPQKKNEEPKISPSPEQNDPVEKIHEEAQPESTPSHKLLGLITEYPAELHQTYQKAFACWLEACSLKQKLNTVPENDVSTAYELQSAIYDTMQDFDKAKKALDLYRTDRTVLPTELKKQLPDDPLELDRRLRNLRTLITKRKQTVQKLQQNLPAPEDAKYHARKEAWNKKVIELEQYILEASEIEKKIKKIK